MSSMSVARSASMSALPGPAFLAAITIRRRLPPRAVVVDPPPVVVEHNDGGCQTKSVNRTDAEGNSETRTKSNCD